MVLDNNQDNFTGIMENDEAFFLRSEKAKKVANLKSRKREGKSDRPGIITIIS